MGTSKVRYSRRDFLKLTSAGVGAALAPPAFARALSAGEQKYFRFWHTLEELPDEKKLGVALVGLGGYSTGQLAPALLKTKLCRLAGIVTGTPAKAKRWSKQYGIPAKNIYNYETYDRIADNPDIDIIYVVLPNGMHAEYTVRGARAGKHLISEKPMATSVADCRAMIDACRKAGKRLSIGYRLHFEPHNQEMMRLGQNEVFGPVTDVDSGFGFPIGNDPDVWRLDKELAGGGPLMDVGIYVVQGSLYTLGKLPVAVTARQETRNEQLFREVEESIDWTLEFPGGVTARGETSYSRPTNHLRANAEDGRFRLGPAFSYGGIEGETSEGPMDFPQVPQQTFQMDDFARCILNNEPTRVPGEMGLRDVKIMTAIYEAARTGKKVALDLQPAQ